MALLVSIHGFLAMEPGFRCEIMHVSLGLISRLFIQRLINLRYTDRFKIGLLQIKATVTVG